MRLLSSVHRIMGTYSQHAVTRPLSRSLTGSGRGVVKTSSQSGVVLVAVVVVLTISLTLFALWARTAVQQHQRMRLQQWRVQAVRLAEAGLRRGLARRATDGEFTQETWRVAAGALDKSHAGVVRILVMAGSDGARLRCGATAEFPAGAVRRAQITKQIEIPISTTGDER